MSGFRGPPFSSQAVAETRGGVAVATRDGITSLPLAVAGLMSPAPYEEVAERSREIGEALKNAGCRLNLARRQGVEGRRFGECNGPRRRRAEAKL